MLVLNPECNSFILCYTGLVLPYFVQWWISHNSMPKISQTSRKVVKTFYSATTDSKGKKRNTILICAKVTERDKERIKE